MADLLGWRQGKFGRSATIGQNKKTHTDIMKFESMKAASAWTGYPLAVIRRAKQTGCDAFVRHTVDLQKLVRWIAAAQKTASELPEGFASWGDVLNHVKSERERIRLDKDKGAVLDVGEVQRQCADAENFYHEQMNVLERTAPAMLRGCNEIEIRDKLGEFLKRLRQLSREKFLAVGKSK